VNRKHIILFCFLLLFSSGFLTLSYNVDVIETKQEINNATNILLNYSDDNKLNKSVEANEYKITSLEEDSNELNNSKEVNEYNESPISNSSKLNFKQVNKYNTTPNQSNSDDDGLSDMYENKIYGTNPTKSDTDNDGLNDSVEVNKHNTNPLQNDSDDDGLNDSVEVNKYGTNPTKSDTDNDGLNDSIEVNKYNTNPLQNDSDGDNISDRTEVRIGINPTEKPDCFDETSAVKDYDRDGVNNKQECLYRTDENNTDTDNDGLSDREEIDSYLDSDSELRNSSPIRKDIHIVYAPTRNNSVDTDGISIVFNNLNVSNPSGKSGINIHFYTNSITEEQVFEGEESFQKLKNEYQDELLDGHEETHSVLLVLSNESEEYDGWSDINGEFSVVVDDNELVAVHEILHATVGEIEGGCEDEVHICSEDGLMNAVVPSNTQELSEKTQTEINTSGINQKLHNTFVN